MWGYARSSCWAWVWTAIVLFQGLIAPEESFAEDQIPLYGLFEVSVTNASSYDNPFTDVELNAIFHSPTGRGVSFFGFYDGDGNGAQTGNVWKQRFMPDEPGVWDYVLTFSDGSTGASGSFECIREGAKPGPWKQDPDNPRWFRTARGEPLLPTAMHAFVSFTPMDWQDGLGWVQNAGYNTIITATMNTRRWGDGWKNVTNFVAVDSANKVVDYDRLNIPMWREWDEMLLAFGQAGIYVGPFEGPAGDYGGQSGEGTVVPPDGLEYYPPMNERFDTPRNLRVIRYMVARQAAFWNLAYWDMYATEIFDIKSKSETIQYGEYLASITPFGRMITCQDIEQGSLRWLSEMNFPESRKLNTIQADIPHSSLFQNAKPNNDLSLEAYRGFPVLSTEALWEGQNRALKPLRMIWGSFAGGTHTMWADWRYEDPAQVVYGSIGRGWVPVKPLSFHLFRTTLLGTDCTGDEELKIATQAMSQLDYWKMNPHNELVSGSTEAYCLAEPGAQYMIYAPRGGTVRLDLVSASGAYEIQWLDPRVGGYTGNDSINGGEIRTLSCPSSKDWVLFVTKDTSSLPPAITTQPQGQTVPEGADVTFFIVATGTPPLSYQWKRDGSDIGGGTSETYFLSSVGPADDGARFRCVVSNVEGSTTSNEATLSVAGDITPPANPTGMKLVPVD